MKKTFNSSKLKWINKPENPENFEISSEKIKIVTESKTDFWQRTFYNFRNDNAPALLTEIDGNFTFTVKTTFNSKKL